MLIVSCCGAKWVNVVFSGINQISLDAKGRLAIPARYRDLLMGQCSGQLVATIDIHQDACLRIYPLPVWEDLASQLEKLPSTNPGVRRIQRLVLGYASNIEMDNSGRILLPPTLRSYAGLEKDLTLVGLGKKLELWSEEKWSTYQHEAISGTFVLPEEIASISF